MKLSLDFHNTHSTPIMIQPLQEVGWRVWMNEGTSDARISVIITDDVCVMKMNERYLSKKSATDVLAFPLTEKDDAVFEGEIYISLDRVATHANFYEVTLEEELRRVLIHGLLHFLGYNDRTNHERVCMKRREDFYLS